MKVKMTEEQYARWQKAEAEFARKENLRKAASLMEVQVIKYDSIWQPTAKAEPLRWPLINIASKKPKHPARSTKVEWVKDAPVPVWPEGACSSHKQPVLHAEYNSMHIFRLPWDELISNAQLAQTDHGPGTLGRTGFVGYGSEEGARLRELLDQIEWQMRHGQRYEGGMYRMAGSVESFLGRWPQKNDHVQFAVLRDLQLRRFPSKMEAPPDIDARWFTYEFIIELTWIAHKR